MKEVVQFIDFGYEELPPKRESLEAFTLHAENRINAISKGDRLVLELGATPMENSEGYSVITALKERCDGCKFVATDITASESNLFGQANIPLILGNFLKKEVQDLILSEFDGRSPNVILAFDIFEKHLAHWVARDNKVLETLGLENPELLPHYLFNEAFNLLADGGTMIARNHDTNFPITLPVVFKTNGVVCELSCESENGTHFFRKKVI